MNDLSEREIETIKLITSGYTNKEIASAMGISSHTVQFHILNIARKLGVSKRVEIAVKAVKAGIA